MERLEFMAIVKKLRGFYPASNIMPTEEAVEAWYEMLADLPGQAVALAVRDWTSREKWPPSISDIRNAVADIALGPVPDWSQAWESLRANIRRFGYYRQGEIMEALDPLTRKVTQRLGLTQIITATDGEYEVNRANFRQIYQTEAERQRNEALIPQAHKTAIEEMHKRGLIDDRQGSEGGY